MIPHDDFTPHGYLDNPYHSWKLNPSGVLRSLPPLGMGWHVPNLGSYVRNQFQYTAHLNIGLKVGNSLLITPEDFKCARCRISSHLHTKNRFAYSCLLPQYGLRLTVRYFLVQEDALGCVLTLSSDNAEPLAVTCYLMHQHTHNPHTSRLWEHGMYARQGDEKDMVMLGIASEGDVFMHGARSADGGEISFGDMEFVLSLEEAAAWAQGVAVPRPHVTEHQEGTGWQVRVVVLPCSLTLGAGVSERVINVVLARGVSMDASYKHWSEGLEQIARAGTAHRADDEQFWQGAPQLSGDWPESWRRGLVYDLETLRMVTRPSVGVIPHPWDGMQIQAPRTVLAEAAMDMLFLGYADPELAAEVILGHFESAPHANLPCMREDGSYNMVADDGQICGTAPEWGFPLWCCDQLFRRTGDVQWLRRLYPGAAAYLRWWLEHRRDAEGWAVYAVSWESGQDVSSRFGPQQTGGTIIQHVRPVDLQASIAQGAAILARWATLLGNEQLPGRPQGPPLPYSSGVGWPGEAEEWQRVADEFTVKTRQMWQDGWFRDYDSSTGEWSALQDTMHLAPVFCGVAGWGQIEQLRPFLAQPPKHSSGWAPLAWPPVVMTLVGAAAAAEMHLDAAELAHRFIDASYRSIDSRTLDEHGGLPGVTREYRRSVTVGKWGEIDYVNAGIEGYGWGALSVHLLVRYILGMREEKVDTITIAPVLPQALRKIGASYRIGPVPWGNHVLSIECIVRDAKGYRMLLKCTKRVKAGIDAIVAGQVLPEPEDVRTISWEGSWGEGRTIQLPQITSDGNGGA